MFNDQQPKTKNKGIIFSSFNCPNQNLPWRGWIEYKNKRIKLLNKPIDLENKTRWITWIPKEKNKNTRNTVGHSESEATTLILSSDTKPTFASCLYDVTFFTLPLVHACPKNLFTSPSRKQKKKNKYLYTRVSFSSNFFFFFNITPLFVHTMRN